VCACTRVQYLENLWSQIETLRKNRWVERFIARTYVTFEGSLCDAIQHPIPLIMLPTHTSDTVYPLPSVGFRLFDYSDVPEVGFFWFGSRGRVAELSLCIVHCNMYWCIIMVHNSTSSSNRSVDMTVLICLNLAPPSMCL